MNHEVPVGSHSKRASNVRRETARKRQQEWMAIQSHHTISGTYAPEVDVACTSDSLVKLRSRAEVTLRSCAACSDRMFTVVKEPTGKNSRLPDVTRPNTPCMQQHSGLVSQDNCIAVRDWCQNSSQRIGSADHLQPTRDFQQAGCKHQPHWAYKTKIGVETKNFRSNQNENYDVEQPKELRHKISPSCSCHPSSYLIVNDYTVDQNCTSWTTC